MDDLALRPVGRPRSCRCDSCPKCKHALYMRGWYRRKTPAQRRAWIAMRDPERVRAHDRVRTGTPARAASLARSKARYPERERARQMVGSRVRRGTIVRQPCAVCGATKVEGHHPDYTKPLEVEWLCRRHHTLRHPHVKTL